MKYFNDCLGLVNQLTPRLPSEDIALGTHFIQHHLPSDLDACVAADE